MWEWVDRALDEVGGPTKDWNANFRWRLKMALRETAQGLKKKSSRE